MATHSHADYVPSNVSPTGACDWSVHEFTDDLGDIIRTIPSPMVIQGEALVGNCLAYSGSQLIVLKNTDMWPLPSVPTFYKIDPGTGNIFDQVTLPFIGFVMDCDWDGNVLWVMKWYGFSGYENILYKVDLQGNLIDQIQLNFGEYTGRAIALEGDHIWVGADRSFANETKLYKLSLTGTVLEEYNTAGVMGWFMGMTIDTQAPSGSNLFAVDNIGQIIKRLQVSGGTVSVVEQFGSPVTAGDYAEGLGFDGEYLFHNSAFGQQGVIWVIDDGITGGGQNVEITLTPASLPITIPPGGGSFDFSVDIINNESQSMTFDAWLDATLPNGATFGPILNRTLTIPGGASISRDLTQYVPGGAPTGSYSYNGYVGEHPDVVWDSDSFDFTKQGEDLSGNPGGWEIYGWDGDILPNLITPSEFILSQNYPNPFNPETTIDFALPVGSKISLKIFNLLGEEIMNLVEDWMPAGYHRITFNGGNLASGIYIYVMNADDFHSVRKMTLIK